MEDSPFCIRPTLRQEWRRFRHRPPLRQEDRLRAGIAGAYLPRLRLDVPHVAEARVSESVPCCAAMVLRSYGRAAAPDRLARVLRTDDLYDTPGRRLAWLRAWGVPVEFPRELQFYRDGTLELNRRLAGEGELRLVFRWEERWLRYVRDALLEGIPPILFVDLGCLYQRWRGFGQAHAVVLCGGDGRQAWIQDPAQPAGPVRVGLGALMDALLPEEPLAALFYPPRGEP